MGGQWENAGGSPYSSTLPGGRYVPESHRNRPSRGGSRTFLPGTGRESSFLRRHSVISSRPSLKSAIDLAGSARNGAL